MNESPMAAKSLRELDRIAKSRQRHLAIADVELGKVRAGVHVLVDQHGASFAELAVTLGLTRERVRQMYEARKKELAGG